MKQLTPAPVSTDKLLLVTISFRLDQTSAAVLAQRAAHLDLSMHEMARRYVVGFLQAPEERVALSQAVSALHENLKLLQDQMASAVEALLVGAGRVSQAQAREWVNLNFDFPCSPSPAR